MKRSFLLGVLFSTLRLFSRDFDDGDTFSEARLDEFYNEFLCEEKDVLSGADLTSNCSPRPPMPPSPPGPPGPPSTPCPPPSPTPSPPPAPTPSDPPAYIESNNGRFPIVFVNNTLQAASNIYVMFDVNSSTQTLRQNIPGTGMVHAVDWAATVGAAPEYTGDQSAIQLSALDIVSSPGRYVVHIPNDVRLNSSRLFISINNPLQYFVPPGPVPLTPTFTTESDTTSGNYYILQDKIEFSLNPGTSTYDLNMNLTAVDFFGLSMLVQGEYHTSAGSSLTYSSTGMSSLSRATVFSEFLTAVSGLESPFNTTWSKLAVTYTNPAAAGGGSCNLYIFAPATVMGLSQTLSNPTPTTFPTDYFLNTTLVSSGCSWFSAVWKGATLNGTQAYFSDSSHQLFVDATTSSGAATAIGKETPTLVNGVMDYNAFQFKVTGGPDSGKTITFPTPTTSKAFFTGAASDYQPAVITTASLATQEQILKIFSSLIIAGLMPLSGSPPIFLNQTNVDTNYSSQYFQNNTLLTNALNTSLCGCKNYPWYDFYSKTLIGIASPSPFYASAYTDFLGLSGDFTIYDVGDGGINGPGTGAAVVVTLNVVGTVPSPFEDTTLYDIEIFPPSGSGAGGITAAAYSTNNGGAWTSLTVGSPTPVPIGTHSASQGILLRATYTTPNGTYITQIAPAEEMFWPPMPSSPVIATTGATTTITFGS